MTFVFSIPLTIVVCTGLVLSLEPVVQMARPAQPITLPLIEEALLRHDPARAARAISIRTVDNTLTIGGGANGSTVVNLGTGEITSEPQQIAQFFTMARRLHETLLLDLGWLVIASTIAMLAIACLGIAMGWPRLRNSLSGWHQGAAWIGLPLVILSPLTGLALAYGITFTPPPTQPSGGGRVTMIDAVRTVAARYDLAAVTAIRPRGRIVMARIYVDGELRGFRVGPNSLEPIPRNWPRVIHEGNWGGLAGPLANVVTSLVLIGLLITGPLIWLRRTLRRISGGRSATRAERALA